MAFSSLPLFPLSIHARPLSLRFQLRVEVPSSIYSSFAPSRPHARRKNHLRPKLPNFPRSPSFSPPTPLTEGVDESSYADGSNPLIVEEVEEAKDTFTSFDVSNDLSSCAERRWFPGPVLDLAARFAVLLAVQTAVAVWFLSREDVEEVGRVKNGITYKGKEKRTNAEKEMMPDDYERMVAEIREMASKVREEEAKGNVDRGVEEDEEESKVEEQKQKNTVRIFRDGQGDGLIPKKKRTQLKVRNGGVGCFPKGKGFGGSKPIRSGSDLGKESNTQTSNMHQKTFRTQEIKRVPEKLPHVNKRHISTDIKVGESKHASENSICNNLIEICANDSEMNKKSSVVLAPRCDRNKENMSDSYENQWWLKLQYVFGIFLHKGSENEDKGLYSLRMTSTHDEKQHPYTIAFQDRGDAMNFSFLLESFFEELGNVRADIVPLTVRELTDEIRSGELKLIVARKGQLCLYAGQPLVEVENTLRSLLE